ncbi:CvpA family protein [Butyrivibrio sp. FCS014]|uniref:CvpA family protein n=1 Tax=Butyrivibrio sp. FCS014 TaxID=1408304 RepID=UPI000463499E|nr:CvpA family protein [Butyrivibrio sp. FCS014]
MSFEMITGIVITIVVVCLFLWRISYGTNNGLFAEAAGLIAAIAAFAAVYYLVNIAGSVLSSNFGNVIPKIGYLVIAFFIYRLTTALGNALRKVKEIPILGGMDRLLGAVLGGVEAFLMVRIVEFVTGISLFSPVILNWNRLYGYVKALIAAYLQ